LIREWVETQENETPSSKKKDKGDEWDDRANVRFV
jgi:hypothetical protein